jgi:transcriptional regulator with XRE-family HTH domain
MTRGHNQEDAMEVRIKEVRRDAGLTQEELAAAIGVGQSQISRMERGISPVTVKHLAAIAAALKVPPATLLGDDGQAKAA